MDWGYLPVAPEVTGVRGTLALTISVDPYGAHMVLLLPPGCCNAARYIIEVVT